LITVSLRASGADLVLIRSTAEVAGVFASTFPDTKVWGSAVVLLPPDTESGVCRRLIDVGKTCARSAVVGTHYPGWRALAGVVLDHYDIGLPVKFCLDRDLRRS
jgi:hypothetical protein